MRDDTPSTLKVLSTLNGKLVKSNDKLVKSKEAPLKENANPDFDSPKLTPSPMKELLNDCLNQFKSSLQPKSND